MYVKPSVPTRVHVTDTTATPISHQMAVREIGLLDP